MLLPVAAAPHAETQERVVASSEEDDLWQASFSPDELGAALAAANAALGCAACNSTGVVKRTVVTGSREIDGRVVELRWVDGASDSVTLNAPKGMGIRGDTLFVSDIDEVRMFDRTTGRPLGSIAIRGVSFLNDIEVGPDGTVYVTDSGLKADFSSSGSDAIYKRGANGQFTPMIRNRNLGAPNGLASAGGGDLYVVSFGSGEYSHITASGERHPLAKPAKGQLDGIVALPGGRVIASSWADSSIIVLDSGATAWRTLIAGVPSPADIGYDSRRERVLIPVFQGNRLEIRKVR